MPRQRSRSPLSPILATESATVRLFFILSVLLCSVNKAGLKTETWLLYCLRLRSRSPHNAKHSTSIYIYIRSTGTSCPKSSTCFFFSDISIFLRRKCYTRFFFSGISIFRNLCIRTYIRTYIRYTYVCHAPCAMELFDVRHGFFGPEGRVLNKGRRDSLSADLRIEKEQGRVADRRLRRTQRKLD